MRNHINTAQWLILIFLFNILGPIPPAQALVLPAPGTMVNLSRGFNPSILKGIRVHPDNPFKFEFILDVGDGHSSLGQEKLKQESAKLMKYFLSGLTIPDKDLWVNLSPYEKDRIIPQSFGLTEMGRDLLAEDYMLKQITASLIYPEGETGKKFWKRVYEEAVRKFGTTNVPVNTFNKVWIVPEKAVVYENAKAATAYVVEAKLKVMLEQDYLAMQKYGAISNGTTSMGGNILREIVIPQLTQEVNEGENFSQLRQVYNSLILAAWYKKKIKDSILDQAYANKNKIAGVQYDSSVIPLKEKASGKDEIESIYQRYLQAFKKGAYNYIKETDMPDGISVPKKYFSGGTNLDLISANKLDVSTNAAMVLEEKHGNFVEIDMTMKDASMRAKRSFLEPGIRAAIEGTEERLLKVLKDLSPILGRDRLPEFNDDLIGTTDSRGNIEIELSNGIIPKSEIDAYGHGIWGMLVKEKVVDDISDTEIQLRPNLKDKEGIVRKIVVDALKGRAGDAEAQAEKIWGILQQARKGYRYYWSLFGFGGHEAEGWEVTIKKGSVVKDFYKLEVQLTRGQEKLDKEFFISSFLTKNVNNRYGGEAKVILDIIRRENFVVRSLAKLIDRPEDLQQNLESLPNFEGMPIILDKKGNAFITVREPVYIFPWYTLGLKDSEGYSATVKEFNVRDGVLTFQVEFSRGKVSFPREFQVGHKTTEIYSKITKGKIPVLDIDERLGLESIKQMYLDQRIFSNSLKKFKSLKGMNLGVTNSDGDIFFTYGHEIRWKIAGTKSRPGWKVTIVDDYINRDGFYEFKVMMSKDGHLPEYYVFEIGRLGYSIKKDGDVLHLFHIVPKKDIARRQIIDLISDIPNYDVQKVHERLTKLIGFSIKTTNAAGSIPLRINDVTYPWRIFGRGRDRGGWNTVIVDAQINGGYNEFTVQFTKGKEEYIRSFQIGRVKKKLEGEELFDIVPLGPIEEPLENFKQKLFIYITRIIREPLDDDMEQRISHLNEKDHVIESDESGQIRISISGKQSIDFQGLEPSVSYKVTPILEEGFGLYVYFENQDKKVWGFETSLEKSIQMEEGRRIFKNPVVGTDLGAVRLSIFNHVKAFTWQWNFDKDVFEESQNLGPFLMPAQLKFVDPNSLPPWFRVATLEQEDKRLRDIYQMGNTALSGKARGYLQNYPAGHLDPDVLMEISASLHWQNMAKLPKAVPITSTMASLIDRGLWRIAGVDPETDKGAELAKAYLSTKVLGLNGVGHNDILSSEAGLQFLGQLESSPDILATYRQLARFAWRWMFYDYIYRVNFKGIFDMKEYNDEYMEVLPYRHAMGLLNGPLHAEFKPFYYLADFAYGGMADLMPYRLLLDKRNDVPFDPKRRVDHFFRLLSDHGNYHISQWHINLIYESLSAAASQGMPLEAQEIWNELRARFARKRLLKDTAMNVESNTGGIDLTSNKTLRVENDGQSIHFKMDPVLLQRVQNAQGFVPVIVNIKPIKGVRLWLGII